MVQQPGFSRAGGEAAVFGISTRPQGPGEKVEETLMEAQTCSNPLGSCFLPLDPLVTSTFSASSKVTESEVGAAVLELLSRGPCASGWLCTETC